MDSDRATCNLVDRKKLEELHTIQDSPRQRGAGTRMSEQANKQVSYCKVGCLQGMVGAYQADPLTSTGQVIPD